MALSANSVVEIRTAGNDTNGGGFVAGAAGTDYSQQDAKNTGSADKSTTDGVANGTTTFTSATANFGTTIVGNIIYLQGGTGGLAAGWYQVTARASTTSITLDRTVAAGTGITMNIGGALASPGMAGGYGLVSGALIWIKAGTYTIASATANIATGCYSTTLTNINIQGYQTSRGDRGTAPLLQASGISAFTVISSTGARGIITNVGVDCAGLTTSRGFLFRGVVTKCYCLSPTNNGFVQSNTVTWQNCYVTGATTQVAFSGGMAIDCYAGDGTVGGFSITNVAIRCISDSNSGTTDGFTCAVGTSYINCVSYGNGRDGFRCSGANVFFGNCIAESNTGTGWDLQSNETIILNNCGAHSDGVSNAAGKGVQNNNFVNNVTGSFFRDAPNRDFSLNNIAGQGALAKHAGFPGALQIGGTGYLDIGALQAQRAVIRAVSIGGPASPVTLNG